MSGGAQDAGGDPNHDENGATGPVHGVAKAPGAVDTAARLRVERGSQSRGQQRGTYGERGHATDSNSLLGGHLVGVDRDPGLVLSAIGCSQPFRSRHKREKYDRTLGDILSTMKPTKALQEQGQSLWLDNITRSMLDSGMIARATSSAAILQTWRAKSFVEA